MDKVAVIGNHAVARRVFLKHYSTTICHSLLNLYMVDIHSIQPPRQNPTLYDESLS
jgi:hypothetical protein